MDNQDTSLPPSNDTTTQASAPPTNEASNASKRTTVLLAIAATAAVVLAGSWFAMDQALTPPQPDLDAASMPQIADYMADSRGLSRLSMEDRREFLLDLVERCTVPAEAADFQQTLSSMAPGEITEIRHTMFDILKDHVIADATQYNELPEDQRDAFVHERISEFQELRQQIRGPGNTFGRAMRTNLDASDTELWGEMMLSRTSARERHIARPFVDHLMKIIEEQRAMRHARRNGNS